MEIKYEICRISKKEADQILETGTHPEGLFFSEHDGRFIGISTTYHSIVSSESFCQGGAWIFFILLTQILSLLLPE